MTFLVTVATYRAITGDNATDPVTVSARIEEAQELLADALDRPLEHDEYTELLYPTRDGRLWPKATPITDGGGYVVEGLGLRSTTLFGVPSIVDGSCSIEVTYSGGWVERSANPAATNRLPKCVERDLAWAAFGLRPPDAAGMSQYPAGARSVSVGDVSVSFGPDGAPRPGDAGVQWSRRTLGYRYRVIGGVLCCP